MRKKICAICAVMIILVILLASFFVYLTAGLESKVNDVSGNIFFTNSTATYKIENVRTSWSYENQEQLQFNFSFSVYEEPSKIVYSLDDQANVTAIGNFTLTELTEGIHYLSLYVTDKSGNTAYQTYHLSMPDQTLFYDSTFYFATIFALLAFVVAFLIIYFKRSQKKIEVTNR